MNWLWFLLIPVGVLLFLFVLFLCLGLILRRTGGYAPGWQLRCTSCNKTKDAAEAGVVRIGGHSRKWTLGYCSHCSRWRWVALERKPEVASSGNDV